MIIGSTDGTIQVYDQNKTLLKSFKEYDDEITFIKPLANNLVACSSNDYSIKIWHATNWSLKLNFTDHSRYFINGVNGLEYDVDKEILLSSGPNGMLVWSADNGTLVKKIQRNTKKSKIFSLLLLTSHKHEPRRRLVMTGGEYGQIKLWDLRFKKD